MRVNLRPALMILLLMMGITGLVYPLTITGIAQLLFPWQANGSLLFYQGHPVGSILIGQPFDAPQYFWPRPSATAPFPYNATASSGSNLGPTNPDLLHAIGARIAALRAADPGNHAPIPVDLVTASGSGLDPHISPAAAEYQVGRIARMRGLNEAALRDLIARHTENRVFGLLGEPRVNVLKLNLALEAVQAAEPARRP